MSVASLREEIDRLNLQILDLLSQRGRVVEQIATASNGAGHHPDREEAMLAYLTRQNSGPYPNEVIRHLFREIFKASLKLKEDTAIQPLKVSRKHQPEDLCVRIGDVAVGNREPVVIAGPCAVESESQIEEVAAALKAQGVRLLRGGAYKPRTSPYSFQGLGQKALQMMREAADRHGLYVVSEVMDPRQLESMFPYVDLFQIGARNMSNFSLLAEVGKAGRPVLLKRSMSSTVQEFLFAAEYVWVNGCDQVILCERGIRTFESATRNTLDLSVVPILKKESHLPVVVDLSHSLGRKDIILPMARAALGASADGLMVEVHPRPQVALSDSEQQLDLTEFSQLLTGIQKFLGNH